MVKKIFNKYSIEVKKVREVMGHDDSQPYNAELWVNKKHIADCFNDGWGGETQIDIIDAKMFKEVADVVCATKGAFGEPNWQYDMPTLADELVALVLKEKYIKKMEKKGLVFDVPNGQTICVPFTTPTRKNVPIAEVMLTTQGQELVKRTIAKYKAKGYTLLNTNIKYYKVLN